MAPKHDTPAPIRRLPGGAIDIRHYVDHCHRRRSEAAHAFLSRLIPGRR